MRPRQQPGAAAATTFALGLVAVVLGYIGYRAADRSLDVPEAAYRAFQLLVLEYRGPATDAPWQLELARFLAVLVVASAVLALAVAVARGGADALRLRLATRNHHLVIGLGDRGATVLARLRAQRTPVAAIESDRAATRVPGARSQGAIVILGDGRDRRILDKGRLAQARHALIVTGDDSTNLEILATCEMALGARNRRAPQLHVAIDDPYLWAQLHRRGITREESSGRADFVSFPDRTARKLVEAARGSVAAVEPADALIWGSGAIAQRTAVHTARRILLSGAEPRIHLAGPDPAQLRERLLSLEPWIAQYVAESAVPNAVDVHLAFVAGLGEADALAAAARLVGSHRSAIVVVEVPHDASARALALTGYDLSRVRLVAAGYQALDPLLFSESALELIARAKHEDYIVQELARGVDPSENPSMVEWEELPASLRVSNRFFAQSVGGKLVQLGVGLTSLRSAAPPHGLPLDAEELDELAQAEHDRWMRDQIADGWRLTAGPKDPDRKLHPLLVPWEELDQVSREKDRDSIRALPMMLARIGYQIEPENPTS